jgi:hypothetical protein
MATARHLFPGNNTSLGFFSYYQYIMPQTQAEHIYCMKGGPGVGKSTLMKNIGLRMEQRGCDVEYLHCSSDPDSLDGVVFPQIHVALIDGTAPHIVDPVNPGAVDEIINLGAYWNLHGIKTHKEEIIRTNASVGRLFKRAYQYIGAAKMLWDNIREAFDAATNPSGVYLEAEKLVEHELTVKPVSHQHGSIRKQFASAITPKGIIHYLDTLIDETYRVYSVKSHWGVGVSRLLTHISNEAMIRGLHVEQYYCALEPENTIEHIVIPQRKLAIFSENEYGTFSQNPYACIDLARYTDLAQTQADKQALEFNERGYTMLLKEAVETLKRAKTAHDLMEQFNIPYMNFDRINEMKEQLFQRIIKCGP